MENYTEKKTGFVLHTNLLETVGYLSNEDLGQLFRAVLLYENNKDITSLNLSGAVAMAFNFIKQDLDRNAEKYNATCKARSEAGKKSAALRKQQKATNQTNVDFVDSETSRSTNVEIVKSETTSETNNESDDESEDEKEKNILSFSVRQKDESVYHDIIRLYNDCCPNLKKATLQLTAMRKKSIDLVLQNYTKADLEVLFKKANNNAFLSGHGTNGWIASFDWIMNPDHLIKISEDTYVHRSSAKGSFNSFSQRDYDFDQLEREFLTN